MDKNYVGLWFMLSSFFKQFRFRGWFSAVPVCILVLFPKSLWACGSLLGGLWLSGDIRDVPPGYPTFKLHL